MILYVYVSNKEYPAAKPLAEDVAGEDHTIRWRNLRHFSGPKELKGAGRVYVYGKSDALHQACKEADVKLHHLTYDGEVVEATKDSKVPSMEWSKEELIEVVKANGISATSNWKKETILEKINEAYNS